MRRYYVTFLLLFMISNIFAQAPRTYNSAEILLQLKKLNVLGSVLYIAAHPDDENTRLLAYLANEKLYRTGYLSLTRGDGGQNLIGDEQGVDLGLIRTQELLAARRIDGAEQFFSRAFDFGYSKSPEEAMRIWGHEKILSDVVWVIRKFRPDVIITRFPTTGEGGHGHHTASAILAGEAFEAAADPTKFPEQLQQGVTIWQAKRLLWNTFNFGGVNTQNESQFKIDCGVYNPILGKSYGEIAAASRSQHKSQGFGVPAQRGAAIEYFKTIKGDAPLSSLMDGVNTGWDRLLSGGELMSRPISEDNIQRLCDSIVSAYNLEHPEQSVPALVRLYKRIESIRDDYWKELKLAEVKKLIENCSGLFIEATTNTAFAVPGDSLKINLVVNSRLGADIINADARMDTTYVIFDQLKKNVNMTKSYTMLLPAATKPSQPYWLQLPKEKGSFVVDDQQLIGKGENDPWTIDFSMMVCGTEFVFSKPIRYKYTDPVKGEIYQPLTILPRAEIKIDKEINVLRPGDSLALNVTVNPNTDLAGSYWVTPVVPDNVPAETAFRSTLVTHLAKGKASSTRYSATAARLGMRHFEMTALLRDSSQKKLVASTYRKTISYDHIPSIVYQKQAHAASVLLDLKTEGNLAGYIPGAGDLIPEALQQMGYRVITLKEADLTPANLRQYDVIVTGVRAYNTNEWLNNSYDALMQYIREGGVLLVQYNTNNSIGPVKARIAPYPFTIGSKRITDEDAAVHFLQPDHPALTYPNKITAADFDGWIQERSIYHAENIDSNYKRILGMKDPGETEQDGSLLVANYGKGRFVYTGLVFFRELPAGVPGAYRLFANLIANKRPRYIK